MGNVVVAPVRLPDGACLYTESHTEGSATAAIDATPITVVLLHGWTLDNRLWRRQIADLPELVGAPIRLLTFDLRGHGRSSSTGRADATLAQLADDLAIVLRDRAPDGRLVLVGHSLGGMTIMEYAHRFADDFARQVLGVVLVSTSAEGSSRTSYGLRPQLAGVIRFLEIQGAGLLARSGPWRPHRLLMPLLAPGVRWLVFGQRVDASWVALTAAMVGSAPLCAIGGFRPAVGVHHRVDALAKMAHLPVAVLVGSRDRLTPSTCAATIAEALPHAEHILCEGAGHMLPIERPDAVTAAIARVCAAASTAKTAKTASGWTRKARRPSVPCRATESRSTPARASG
jgi:pimeloyl-ACP methyl ester carboxylesterase